MEYLQNWPYLAWAAGAATTFYLVTAFATSHLHPDKKAALSLWLQGDYESTWSTQFCAMFDRIFGENHLRPRCIILSALASVAAVFALWLLFDRILGLISLRADTGLSLTQVLLLGAAINIIPDYVSLYETRWLLKAFERIRNPVGQLAVLILDAAVTGLIIFAGIKGYLWLTGTPQISLVEMMALFSIYAVFFYSTFLTSIWAWAYCLSSWLSRLSAHLRGWLDVSGAPGRALALLGAAFVLAGALFIKPFITVDENGRTVFDGRLCSMFPSEACKHIVKNSPDIRSTLRILNRICSGIANKCFDQYESEVGLSHIQIARLLREDCLNGEGESCVNLGHMYRLPVKMEQDFTWSSRLYEMGCEHGNPAGCAYFGHMYDTGQGVEQNYFRAASLYLTGCEAGEAWACSNLGVYYQLGQGVRQDYARALEFYKQGCDGGNALGCSNLGALYQHAEGVELDYARSLELYKQGCDWGLAKSCTNLGFMYHQALGVEQNYPRARDLYKQGCVGGNANGCTGLGILYEKGLGLRRDLKKAQDLFQLGCDMQDEWACEHLVEFSKIPK